MITKEIVKPAVTRKLGIVGGMGPEATVRLFQTIVALTEAKADSEHLEILIHNNSQIPDRTKSILGTGPPALPELMRSLACLTSTGAEVIAIPCMTSHYYLKCMQEGCGARIINAIAECVAAIRRATPQALAIGILATTGTIRSNLFQERLEASGMRSLTLPEPLQESLVMSAIYGAHGIKAGSKTGRAREELQQAAGHLVRMGADAIIAGCTEVPLAISQKDLPVHFVDSLEVLARAAIFECHYECRD